MENTNFAAPRGFADRARLRTKLRAQGLENATRIAGLQRALGEQIPDRIRAELQSLANEPNGEILSQGLLRLGRNFGQSGDVEKAAIVFGFVREQAGHPESQVEAERELNALLGKGQSGYRAEILLGSLVKTATDYRTIAPMLAGTVVGQLAKNLSSVFLLDWAPAAWISRGIGNRWASGFLSYAIEVPTFTLASRLLGPNRNSFSVDLQNSALSLGAIKLAHAGTSALMAKLELQHPLAAGLAGQLGTFTGLAAAHRMETAFGLRQPLGGENFLLDTFATMLSLGVGANLGNRLLRPKFFAWQSEMTSRSQNASRPGFSIENLFSGPKWELNPVGASREPLKPLLETKAFAMNLTKPMQMSAGFSEATTAPSTTNPPNKSSAESLITRFLFQADGFLAKQILEQLGSCPENAARDFLLEVLSDAKRSVALRNTAAAGLASRNDLQAVEVLLNVFRAEPPAKKGTAMLLSPENILALREGMIRALGTIRDGSARDILLNIANTPRQRKELQLAALSALGETQDRLAVEPLIKFVKDAKASTFRQRAIVALGKIGGTDALKFLSELAKDPQQLEAVRKSALSAMGKLTDQGSPSPGVGDELIGALHTLDGKLRAVAAHSLAGIGDPRSTEELLEALKSETDPEVQNSIIQYLLKNPDARIIPLVAKVAQEHPSYQLSSRALNVYVSLAGAAAREPLEQLSRSETDRPMLTQILAHLTEIGDVRSLPAMLAIGSKLISFAPKITGATFTGPEAVTTILSAFPLEPNEKARTEMINFLAGLKDERTPGFFNGLLEQGTEPSNVLSAAVTALTGNHDLRSLRALIKTEMRTHDVKWYEDPSRVARALLERSHFKNRDLMLTLAKEGDFDERTFAMEQLRAMREPAARDYLIDSLRNDPDAGIRRFVAELFQFEKRLVYVDALIESFNQDPAHEVRFQAMLSLRDSKDPRIRDLVIRAMADPDANMRSVAIWRLGDFRRSEDFALHCQILREDPDPKVRLNAAEALISRGLKAIDPLITALENDVSPDVRRRAATTLSLTHSRRSISALQKASTVDSDEKVRETARSALEAFD